MSLSDLIFGKPHRVLQVRMELLDEETGQVLSRKTARVHETDLPAGKLHLVLKAKELLVDALFLLGHKKPDGMTWMRYAESKFEASSA